MNYKIMKVGDIIYKNNKTDEYINFIINKPYQIIEVGYSIEYKTNYICILNEYHAETMFYFDKSETYYIWDYFYKPNELRKNKLKTIIPQNQAKHNVNRQYPKP